tara:strand:- start:624 stop:1268 length:645 start_codon:yes stop_codon:yes gene_type:complete
MSEMSKTKEKLIDAAIEYFNTEGTERISVKKLIKIADVGYGTFYNHFDSVEEVQIEALNKTVRNVLIEFKLGVKNEKDYVYIIYLALLRGINLLANSPSINWLLKDVKMVIQVFKEISQPNMENNFLNAVKAKQIQNTDIDDLMQFKDARHYMQWAAIGAVEQVVNGELSEKEAFAKLAKNVTVVDIPNEQRDQIIDRILNETFHWETKDNDDR